MCSLDRSFTARDKPAHKVRRGDGEADTLWLMGILDITACYWKNSLFCDLPLLIKTCQAWVCCRSKTALRHKHSNYYFQHLAFIKARKIFFNCFYRINIGDLGLPIDFFSALLTFWLVFLGFFVCLFFKSLRNSLFCLSISKALNQSQDLGGQNHRTAEEFRLEGTSGSHLVGLDALQPSST